MRHCGRGKGRAWKLRNQILPSRMEKERMWSTNGFARRACGGTPKICAAPPVSSQCAAPRTQKTHMRKDLLAHAAPRLVVELLGKAEDGARALEAVAAQLELVHGVRVLDVQLDARPVRRLGGPHVQVRVAPRLEVERVVARVQVRELGQQPQLVLRVQLRVWCV